MVRRNVASRSASHIDVLRNCHWFVPNEPMCCTFGGTKARHMDSVSVHAVIMILDSWHLKLWNFQLLQCSCFGLPSVDNWHKHLFLSLKKPPSSLLLVHVVVLKEVVVVVVESGCECCIFKNKSDLWDLWVLLLSLQLWFRLDWVSLKHLKGCILCLSVLESRELGPSDPGKSNCSPTDYPLTCF